MWADEIDAARHLLCDMRASAQSVGDEVSLSVVDLHLTELECRAGELEAARTYADEAMATIEYEAEDRGLGATLYAKSLAAAHRGDAELARQLGMRGLELAARFEDHVFSLQHHSVLGFLELSVGDAAEAVAQLAHMPGQLEEMGVGEPGVFLCHADLIEALIGVGDHEEAESRLEEWEALGRAIDRPRVLCTAARARGLLCAARGDLPRRSSTWSTHSRCTTVFRSRSSAAARCSRSARSSAASAGGAPRARRSTRHAHSSPISAPASGRRERRSSAIGSAGERRATATS